MKITIKRTRAPHPALPVLPAMLAMVLAPVALAQQQAVSGDAGRCGGAAQSDPACKADQATQLDTVQVRGVRGSIADAIALKQQNTQINDSIVAEDICDELRPQR